MNSRLRGSNKERGRRGVFFSRICMCELARTQRLPNGDGLLQRLTAATAASWPSGDEPALRLWPVCSSARRPCTGASRTRDMTAKCGPDHRSMAPAYRQACSHGQHWRLRRDPAGQRGTLACCGPRRVALPTAVRTKSACASYAPQSFRGPSAFMDIMSGRRARCGWVRPAG